MILVKEKIKRENGHTLLEMIIVISIIILTASIGLSVFRSQNTNKQRGALNLQSLIAQRQAAALKLLGAARRSAIAQTPLPINLSDPADLAEINYEGTDTDRNGIDDNKNTPLTYFNGTNWVLAHKRDRTDIGAYTIADQTSKLASIPEIPGSQFATALAFDDLGRPAQLPTDKTYWAVYGMNNADPSAVIAVTVTGQGTINNWVYNAGNQQWTKRGGQN